MAARQGQVIVPDQEAGRLIIMRAITGLPPVMTMARRGAPGAIVEWLSPHAVAACEARSFRTSSRS
jgi:hypothetical protein